MHTVPPADHHLQPFALDWSHKFGLEHLKTPFAQHVLSEMADTYVPFVLANRDAQEAGAKAFHADIYGEKVSYLTRPYPETSRQMVAKRIASLDTRDQIDKLLKEYGLSQVFC